MKSYEKKLWLSIETDNELVNNFAVIGHIQTRLNKIFYLPYTAAGKSEAIKGIPTTDRHGKFAFPQFDVFVSNNYRISVIWDKIYFCDEPERNIRFFSSDKGWCWFENFTDDKIISMFLMAVREGVLDYINKMKEFERIGQGFHIYFKTYFNSGIEAEYLPTSNIQ